MDADDADDGIVEARGGSSVRRQSLEETALELRSRASTWTLLLLTLMVFCTVVAASGAAAGANKSCENALADLAHGAFGACFFFVVEGGPRRPPQDPRQVPRGPRGGRAPEREGGGPGHRERPARDHQPRQRRAHFRRHRGRVDRHERRHRGPVGLRLHLLPLVRDKYGLDRVERVHDAVRDKARDAVLGLARRRADVRPVSYTHLTLPTILLV